MCTGLLVPTVLAGCPGDSASPSTGESSDTGSSDATTGDSTGVDPDSSTTDARTTTATTVDPDSSSSGSSEESSSGGFVGCGDGDVDAAADEQCDGDNLDGRDCASEDFVDCTLDLAECVGCGNGDQDPGEDCDTNDFGGVSCSDLGFDGGSLTCTGQCEIVSDSCAGLHAFCTSPDAAIGPGAGALTQSTIPVAGLAGIVLDVDVLVDGSHTALGDLVIDVRHVDTNQSVSLAADQCGVGDDINATFDQDAGSPPTCVGTPAISGNVQPLGNLDAYVGTVGPGNGTWELTVLDQTDGNGGALEQWCVAITTGRTVRPNLLQCGNSSRDISAFIPEGEEFEVMFSCTPDEDTQAILITRDGAFDGPTLQSYVANGGIVLTEVFISDAVFNAIFNEAVLENGFFGSCTDIAPTVEQFTPGDPFWTVNDPRVVDDVGAAPRLVDADLDEVSRSSTGATARWGSTPTPSS